MNSTDEGGTYPLPPIELPMNKPIPQGCVCKWDYDVKRRIKGIKFLAHACDVMNHRQAWNQAQEREQANMRVELPGMKRQRGDRGKDKNPRKRPEEKSALTA